MKNSSSTEIWNNNGNNVAIAQTGAWTPVDLHAYNIGNLEAGETYTMTITGVSKSGSSYYGNFGNFSFHKSSQYADNWNNTTDINVTDFYFNGAGQNGTYINNIDAGDYVEFYTYAPNTTYYGLNCGIGYSTAGTDNFTITITDVATSTIEVNEVNYTVNSTHLYSLTSKIDEGWKKIRLAFPTQPASKSCRVEHIKFYPFENLPLMEAGGVNTYLDLSKGSFGRTASAKYNHDPAYESGNQNIGYNGDGGYAEFYVGNTNETAYYDFHIGTNRYQNDATFTLTITDVATSTVEVNQSGLAVPSGSSYADQTYKLTSPITPGLKLIRIETASSSNSYAFNYNHVSFYKRSLNENYNYAPVAATGVDIVLTRSIAANKWSTIVLPFAMTAEQITSVFGDGTKVAELSSKSDDVLHFTSATTMDANKPYLIKVNSNFTSATIDNVNIEEGTPSTTVSDVEFVGSYNAETEIPASTGKHTYYFISNNTLYSTASSGTANKMRGTRAYFKVPTTAGARQMSFTVDEEGGETTGNSSVNRSEGIMQHEYFDLQGRKVAQPAKGLYIVNGKKVVIK